MKFDGFIGPTYVLAYPSESMQRLVNLYPETNEAGPRKGNVARFKGTPGLRKQATVGNGPHRGIYEASTGQVFAVSGNGLFELTSHFDVLQRPGFVGNGTGRVTMVDDGTNLLIGDGTSVAYQALIAPGSSVGPVADPNCPGGFITWQDGYFCNSVPNSRQFQISGLNAVTYNPTDVGTKEGRPDLLVTVLSVNRQLWLFGELTTEVWWNSGNALFPFARIDGAYIETGTIAAATCVRANGSVAWVGNNERGRGTVWWANGYQPQRISTHAVELALNNYSRLPEATAYTYQQGGHEFYCLSVPGKADGTQAGGTWVYDFATQQWHERIFLNATDGEEPHRASVATVGFNQILAGDRVDGRLYTYDLGYFLDDANPIRRIRQTPHTSKDEHRILYRAFELQVEPGQGLQSGPTPQAMLSWSDDGGHTWSNEYEASMGAVGQYSTRVRWRRLGAGRDRVFRVATSEAVPIVWLGAELELIELDR